MSHELTEKIAGLASRIDNLAVRQTGNDSRILLGLRDKLTDLTVLAITLELNAEDAAYDDALHKINDAITLINDADKSIENISKIISHLKDGVDAAGVVIQKAASLL